MKLILLMASLSFAMDLSPLNFVSADKSWKIDCKGLYGKLDEQESVGADIKEKILEIAPIITEMEFDEVLKAFGELRRNIGEKYNHLGFDSFGKDRVRNLKSPLVSLRYQKYGIETSNLIELHSGDVLRTLRTESGSVHIISRLHLDAENNFFPTIYHSTLSDITAFRELAKIEFEKAKGQSGEEALNSIARMHFFLSAATPHDRGSSAVSEYFARALALNKGIRLGPISDKVPDLEVLVFGNIDKFTSEYRSFYNPVIPQEKTLLESVTDTVSQISFFQFFMN